MKRILLLLSLVYTSLAGLHAQQFVHTKGSQLVDTLGQALTLRGVNLGNWLVPEGYMFHLKKTAGPSQIHLALTQAVGRERAARFWADFQARYITRADIRYIRQMGANHIRVPFHYGLFTEENYLGANRNGFALLDSVISWCAAEGLYVILDMHCAPGGQTGDNIDDSPGFPYLFTEPSSQQQFIDIWVRIAQRYAQNKTVAGYDLLNEPIAHYFKTELDSLNKLLEPLFKRAVTAIRKVDSNHTILLAGAQWNTNFSVFGKPFDNNLMYTFHKYWMPTTQEEIQSFLDFRSKYNVPLYLGESGENTDEWVAQFRALLDEHGIHWAFWPYKKLRNTRGPVNFEVPEEYYQVWVPFAEGDRSSYGAIRERNIDRRAMERILSNYLQQCQLSNCFPNPGYIQALGFRIPDTK